MNLRGSLRLALAYLAFAHMAIAVACVLFAMNAGRWPHVYHPQVIAVVHLITLGWITGCILGMFYVLAPLALRVPMPASRWDYMAGASFMAGVSSIPVTAWTGRYAAIAGGGVLVLGAIARVGYRLVLGLNARRMA